MPTKKERAALAYATRWRVFPVGPDKAPLVRWREGSTRNVDQITRWWRQWPDANIGLDLPLDLVVLDFDPRNGGDPNDWELPVTKVCETAGGGWHYYYRLREGAETVGHMGDGIDVKRGGRGYVLLPPSTNEAGSEYRWSGGHRVAQLPEHLAALILRDAPRAEPRGFQFVSGYGQRALEAECGRLALAEEGRRNHQLNASAFALGQLVAGGELREDVVRDALEHVAAAIGLPATEVAITLESGLTAGARSPRTSGSST